jgi:hypothetical protein
MLLATSGCSQLDLGEGVSWPWSKPEPETPARMVDTWTDTVLWQPGKPGMRGFGGRIMFFGEDDDDPILVDGALTVYAFDEEDPNPDKPPEKKYIFLADKLSNHYSESKVGHSFSFWLPWDDVGGLERHISLIARFENRDGKVVMSKAAHKTLPGKQPKPEGAIDEYAGQISRMDDEPTGAVRQVAHQAPVERPKDNSNSSKRMKTTTIELTPTFARRLAAASQPQAEPEAAISPGSERAYAKSGTSGRAYPPATADSPARPSADSKASPEESNEQPGESAGDASPSDRPGRSRFPARTGAADGPAYGPFRMRPRPARWPSPLPRTRRPEQFRYSPATTPADESAAN